MEGGNPLPPSVRKAEMTQPGPRRAGALRSATFFSTVADLEPFQPPQYLPYSSTRSLIKRTSFRSPFGGTWSATPSMNRPLSL